MNKKAKKACVEVPQMYGSSYAFVDDKARLKLKYDNLLQDYHELLRDAEAKKKKLQKINQKKLGLLNEVRFLRMRYKKLTENPSQQIQCVVLKKQSFSIEPNSEDLYRTKQYEAPSTSRVAKLAPKLTSLLNEEEREDPRMQRTNIKGKNLNNWYVEDEKESIFPSRKLDTGSSRNFGTGSSRKLSSSSSRSGKRKITWEDQVALQV